MIHITPLILPIAIDRDIHIENETTIVPNMNSNQNRASLNFLIYYGQFKEILFLSNENFKVDKVYQLVR